MRKNRLVLLLIAPLLSNMIFLQTKAGEIHDKAVVASAAPQRWQTFPLRSVRLLPGSDFYNAMNIGRKYLMGMDVERMLNRERMRAGLPEVARQYPGSAQPEGTRPGDLYHYLSAISLLHAQTGDAEALRRSNYIIQTLAACHSHTKERKERGDTTVDRRIENVYKTILGGRLVLEGPDEFAYPWGGLNGLGNFYYVMHKFHAALRDAYLYCNNDAALRLWIAEAEPTTHFVLKTNPDLFDGMLDVEHGGMNEVYADLYALTGDKRYLDVSFRFNHQKVVLNIANGMDNLYGRHANTQVPIFAGTARQYQLTGNEISSKATGHFFDFIYNQHMSAIGGNSRYERFGRPGETTRRLGYTANETCNTYNMLKVALRLFESTGQLRYMDYFERALYNHILASQNSDNGGVTYYMSLMPGGFKAFSKGYDLAGVWCCVGTGMENHSKYGEAVFFHDEQHVMVNLFIPATLEWEQKGLKFSMQTGFPKEDGVTLRIDEAGSFDGALMIRKPHWAKEVAVLINGKKMNAAADKEGYIVLKHPWKKGDVVTFQLPQTLWVERSKDDPNMTAIFHGPLLLASPLGAAQMPGPDTVRQAHFQYRQWIPPTDDIPLLVADTSLYNTWIKKDKDLHFTVASGAVVGGKLQQLKLIPFYKLQHQRQNVYWKLFSPDEWQQRRQLVADEINVNNESDEKAHSLQGERMDTSRYRDERNFWENNRIGRFAKDGGHFSYTMKWNGATTEPTLVVTYWGGEPARSHFDVLVNGTVVATEMIDERFPLTYFDALYPLPESVVKNAASLTVTFKAKPGKRAGAVYGLLLTGDADKFKYPLYY